ncbi:Appr-1-p processing protein [Marivirga tractuosa]|uniref:Appr-1-p processing domain protein n=1 Tax=Marivirga tractuosa (strain ATCC 23168 / DSM 4126 / NBRC 15989 / NCIMB 1408 / VKM B-1430 / H-43) TaxID=643867 RepID=E4TUJ6_MARTH|nr:macro domain-containing protein [Marivirga tractuosa]ADR23089.1 Appr-1-p processing domain protein [Marivirga tractuosa DSM 4126]BDD16237.1 Appr-1-p processing protein [Marivirga tractuosa]
MKFGDVKIEAIKGDITKQDDIEAIVNAANAQLQMGGGVAGAIHAAAGKELAEETKSLAPVRVGEAVVSGGHNLPNKYIIHTLGPVYGFNQPEEEFLANCYKNSLLVAEETNIKSIAFPAISTGAFGYPFEAATEIALSTVRDFAKEAKSIQLIRFVLFSEKDFQHYHDRLNSIK